MPATAIHIALTFDDNFWAPAYATMRSVCLATRRRTDLVFHLCHRTLTPAHKADLDEITTEFGSTLVWYDLDKDPRFADIASRAHYNKRLSNIVYARLMFDTLLPAEVERLVYLDCDIYVRGDIAELAEMDMQDYPVAGVADPLHPFVCNHRDINENRDLFDPADPYFNAGVLLIDRTGWHDAGILSKLETAIADGTLDRIYYDQDFLNLVFKNNWLQLDPLWNLIEPLPPHQALDPHILHYADWRKPWLLWSGAGFARAYRHVMTNRVFYAYFRHRLKRRLGGLIGRR